MYQLKYFNNYVLDPAHLTAADREAPSKSFRTFPAKDRRYSEAAGGGGADRSLSERIGGRLTEAPGDDQEVSYVPGNKYQKAKNGLRNNLAPPPGMALDPRASRFTGAAYADLVRFRFFIEFILVSDTDLLLSSFSRMVLLPEKLMLCYFLTKEGVEEKD